MLSLNIDDITRLEYIDRNNIVPPVKRHGIELILNVQQLLHFLYCNEVSIYNAWKAITCNHFPSSQFSTLSVKNPTNPVKEMMIEGITIDSTYEVKAMREFRKSIKRDPKLFPVLGRETGWDKFNEALMIEAKAQDMYPKSINLQCSDGVDVFADEYAVNIFIKSCNQGFAKSPMAFIDV